MIEHELRALLDVLGVLLHARVDDRTLRRQEDDPIDVRFLEASYVVQDAGPVPVERPSQKDVPEQPARPAKDRHEHRRELGAEAHPHLRF